MSLRYLDTDNKTGFHIKNWHDRTEGGVAVSCSTYDGSGRTRAVWTPYGDISNVTFDTFLFHHLFMGVHGALSAGQVCENLRFVNGEISFMYGVGAGQYAQGVYLNNDNGRGAFRGCAFENVLLHHNGWLPDAGLTPWATICPDRCHHVYSAPGGGGWTYRNCIFSMAAMNAFRGLPAGNVVERCVFIGNGSAGGGAEATWKDCVVFIDSSKDPGLRYVRTVYRDVVDPPWELDASNPPRMVNDYPDFAGYFSGDIWHRPHNDPSTGCKRYDIAKRGDWDGNMQGFDPMAWLDEVVNTPVERRKELPDMQAEYVWRLANGEPPPAPTPPPDDAPRLWTKRQIVEAVRETGKGVWGR